MKRLRLIRVPFQHSRRLCRFPLSSRSFSASSSDSSQPTDVLDANIGHASPVGSGDPTAQLDPYATTTATDAMDVAAEVVTQLDPYTSPSIWPLTDNAIWLVQSVHEQVGLPWFAAIASTTLLMRTVLLPLAVKSMKNAAKLAEVQPEMSKVQERMKNARTDEEKQAHAKEMRNFMSKHNVNPLATFVPILAQMPIFMSFFFGLQRMATDYPSLSEGGMLWFKDLTVADPTYGLPILASISFLITIELGGEAGQQQQNPEQQKTMKNVMRALAVGMVPLTMSMPASVFMYWVTSNTFSCIQTAAFKVPGVKNALGIPTIVPPPPAAATSLPNSTAPLNFSSSLKDIPPPPSASLTDAPLPEADHQNSAVNRKNRKKKQRKRRKK